MAGHSKWNNIKRQKGAQDAKRAKIFTKIAREMTVAVKEGGSSDPLNNTRLAAVIAKAKAANMPNDNIKRTIEKAAGAGSGSSYEEVTYEGYGPNGVAVIVEAMTDNRNRIASEIRLYFDKYGGKMGTSGCVSWSFDKKGVIIVDNSEGTLDEDTVLTHALEADAQDVVADGEVFVIYTDPDDFTVVNDKLIEEGYALLSAQVEMVPQNYVALTDPADIKNMEKILDLMEDNDDVQNVWHNFESE